MELSRRAFLEGILVSPLFFSQAYAFSSFTLPDIEGFTDDGKTKHLSSFYGKPLLLHAWGAYCPPCIADLPTLTNLESMISVLGLYDMARDDFPVAKAKIDKIFEQKNHHSPNLLLPRNSLIALNAAFVQNTRESSMPVPTYFLVNVQGICTYLETGSLNEKDVETLKKNIRKL